MNAWFDDRLAMALGTQGIFDRDDNLVVSEGQRRHIAFTPVNTAARILADEQRLGEGTERCPAALAVEIRGCGRNHGRIICTVTKFNWIKELYIFICQSFLNYCSKTLTSRNTTRTSS